MEMQDEFEEGCCRRNQLVIFWFETVKLVSAVAMPYELDRQLCTSCSAGRPAGLDWIVLDFIQMRVGICIYYRN